MKPNWQNRTLWTGDNLDILRGMNSDCVDLIYLDPPFNSNRTYSAPIGSEAAGAAFKDSWTLDDVDLAWHGEIAEREPALYGVIDAAGLAHSKSMKSYLIMMAVRLLEMKRIVKKTGSLYVHCDDAASHYLKMLMDCIFGKTCFRNEIVWQRYGSHNDARKYGRVSDRLLFYALRGATWNTQRLPLDDETVARNYRHKDERGALRRRRSTPAPCRVEVTNTHGEAYTISGNSRKTGSKSWMPRSGFTGPREGEHRGERFIWTRWGASRSPTS